MLYVEFNSLDSLSPFIDLIIVVILFFLQLVDTCLGGRLFPKCWFEREQPALSYYAGPHYQGAQHEAARGLLFCISSVFGSFARVNFIVVIETTNF